MNDRIKIVDGSGDKEFFTIIPNHIINHSTAIDRAVYVEMKRFAGEKGVCWASKETMMKRLGIGKKALKNSIEYLLKRGWIEHLGLVKVGTKGGNQKTNAYRVSDIWKLNSQTYKGGSESTPLSDKGGVQKEPKGGSESNHKEDLLEEDKESVVADAPTIPPPLKKEEEYDFDKALKELHNKEQKHLKIIALYWKRKNYYFENRQQFNAALKRDLRPASNLKGYNGIQIQRAIEYCVNEYDRIPWTLETVGKVIRDVVNKK